MGIVCYCIIVVVASCLLRISAGNPIDPQLFNGGNPPVFLDPQGAVQPIAANVYEQWLQRNSAVRSAVAPCPPGSMIVGPLMCNPYRPICPVGSYCYATGTVENIDKFFCCAP